MKLLLSLLLMIAGAGSKAQKIKMDTLLVKDSLIVIKVDLTAAELKIQKAAKIEKVLFKVFYNRNGSLLNEYKAYQPAENEVTFFYALDYVAKKTEMLFKIGQNLLPVYKKKNFDQMLEIVKLLEHRIFDVGSFSGMGAYNALEVAIQYQ